MATQLYESDFYGWTQEQSARLRDLALRDRGNEIDFTHIAEEIESMGRSQRSELVNRLAQTLEHLLKLAFSPSWEPRNMWRNSVRGQRYSIAKLLRQNPSLKPFLNDAYAEAYQDAVQYFDAEKLIALTMEELPGLSPFDLEDVLRDDWYPAPEGMPNA